MSLRKLALGTAFLASAVAANPPPVPLSPVVQSEQRDARLRDQLVRLIEMMGQEGHFAVDEVTAGDVTLQQCWFTYRPDEACLAGLSPKWTEEEPVVAVIVDEPMWRQASIRIRCVGPDIAKYRDIELYLSDALHRPSGAAEKSKLAGCMIGALHGPPEARD